MSISRSVRRLTAAAAVLVAAAAQTAVAQRRVATSATVPSLIVFITVDQMRPDYFERYASQLTGGLGRLYRGGAFYTDAHQDHAITETAPGHSVTMSGRFPAHTGIVANVFGVNDPRTPVIGGGGPGASPFRFRGSTLIDWLRVTDPRSRALSVSRKDRGAILPLGRAKESVFWFGTDGRFSTSTYYADTLPTWVQEFNAKKIPQSYAGKSWTLLLADSAYKEVDRVRYEADGEDIVFPHAFPTEPGKVSAALVNYPVMDSLTAQFALAGVNALNIGRGPQTDILAVSFSTTDAVGHRYGPDSREIHDQVLRLDRYMGAFIDSLYKLRDSSTIAFALTADHGVQPYPELRAEREHKPALRADIEPVVKKYAAQLQAAKIDAHAISIEEGMVSINRPALTKAGLKPDSILASIARDLRKVTGIARVDLVKDLPKADTTRDAVARRWLHMLPPDDPAALVFSLAPFAYYKSTNYATHGTPNDLDSRVPVIFYGPWFVTGKFTKALVADMAPTLAAIADVSPIERVDGRVRSEALKAASRK
ncbi:MAG TPA: alkaline phosphatase family protein [Gemmatimonadaceae bacterium]